MSDTPTPRDVIAKLMAGTFGDLCSMLPDADAILSALTAAGYVVEQGWQPIETAPRDGTDFLALIPWQRKHHQMAGCFARDGKFRSWPGRITYTPSHWRPLPAGPTGAPA